ncbi:MAG: ATP-dependent DNA ligase [Acidimicrobiia bacterium]|nr:ATP-dependent DNA ligase [Acidimicrobiia bacterium]
MAKETHVLAGTVPVRISSPDKVVFPDEGWTKLEIAQHYVMCGDGALRGVYNRPTMLKRWIDGVGGDPFYMKRVPESARSKVDVVFPSSRPGRMFLPLEVQDVVWLAQMNCLDLHPWNARASDLDHADELRIDLDPTDGFGFDAIINVAHTIRTILEEIGLVGWPKTSGNRGIHIYARLRSEWTFYEVRRACLAIAREAERRNDLATTAWWKEERSGVFIDYNQNARDRTMASAYSIRHTGWVSTPFQWDELDDMTPARFDLMSFKDRWEDVGDLTDGIDEAAGDLTMALDWVARDEADGIGDAPWPPHYPKMPGEPPRVQPSRRKMEI